jgi:fructoselysine-6-P-deglycase FrlB-like protein
MFGAATRAEIASQPEVWQRAAESASAFGPALSAPGERVLVVGCGTSAFVALAMALLRERAGLGETDWAYASEIPPGRTYDRVVALTRSGTTTEVLDALERVTAPRRVVVTAVAAGPAHERADDVVVLDFADETSVVQTRFPTATLVLARTAFGEDTTGLPALAAGALVEPLPAPVGDVDHFVYLARGWALGLAHEAALKIRESAQANAESYPALDYRHGPITLAGERSLVWAFGEVPAELVRDVSATGATVRTSAQDPLAELVLAQRFAVAMAEHRGLDPDHPRHLTRSVILDGSRSSSAHATSHEGASR